MRWGFRMNNENNYNSDDVFGGIGLPADTVHLFGGASAGNFPFCCSEALYNVAPLRSLSFLLLGRPAPIMPPPSLSNPTLRITIASAANTLAHPADVAVKIRAAAAAANRSVAVTILPSTTTRAFDLAAEDVVLVFTSISFASSQASLHAYIDSGGGVVITSSATASTSINGFDYGAYSPINFPGNSARTANAALGVYNSSHPILEGVSSISSGSGGYFGAIGGI